MNDARAMNMNQLLAEMMSPFRCATVRRTLIITAMMMNERNACMKRSWIRASFATVKSITRPRIVGRSIDEMVRTENNNPVKLAFASLARRPAPARAAATKPPPMRIEVRPVIKVTSTNVANALPSSYSHPMLASESRAVAS